MDKRETPFLDSREYKTLQRGRELVSTQAAISAQQKLVAYMTPLQIRSYITTDIYDPIAEEIMMRYIEKYVSSDFNGFAEYCDEMADDELFIERVVSEALLDSDLEAMRLFIEERGGTAF